MTTIGGPSLRWMRKHARVIAAAALLGMLLPIAAQALNSVAAIGSFVWGLILFIVVAVVLGTRWWSTRTENDRVLGNLPV